MRSPLLTPTPATRMELVEQNFDQWLAQAALADRPRTLDDDEPLRPGRALTARKARELFEDMVRSRAIDVAARELKKTQRSFYTIGSSGHEMNACLGARLRLTDACFLHYRSGALMMARARNRPGSSPLFDTMLSLVAAAEDPASGGRHKVWGSRDLWVPPQTSTIASHLPKAFGFAFALSRARRMDVPSEIPGDAIVACSFGDASANHATALTAINASRFALRRGVPAPVLWVCEDNGIGISVETPTGWIADTFSRMSGMEYVRAEGELPDVDDAVSRAIRLCRTRQAPVFLHLSTVRLGGHAGTDLETAYRSLDDIEAIEARDPVLNTARLLVESGAATAQELIDMTADVRERLVAIGEEVSTRRKLVTREEVMAPLAPYDEQAVRADASGTIDASLRRAAFGKVLPEDVTSATKKTLAAHVNAALHDEMLRDDRICIFGEDVGRKGGVYYVTANLQKRFGAPRVFDSILDETSILGVAQGLGQVGLLPIPEIQYLAYIHNALDQIRGEACSLSYFSNGTFTNPMVVRVAGLAYQKGFGGHFHNDNSLGALRDIPGLALACPSRGDDAVKMLRTALAMARVHGRVVAFLEPIALYHERDLHEAGDEEWLFDYPPPGSALLPGEVGVYGEDASDLVMVTYGNGVRLALRAARKLAEEHGKRARVIDLRWLAPLPIDAVAEHVGALRKVLVVDECRATGGGIAGDLIAALVERGINARYASVRAADSYVPLGPATSAVLVTEEQILDAAVEITR